VAVKVIPVLGVGTDVDGQLVGEGLCGALNRFVARQLWRDRDRLARGRVGAAWASPFDEARHQRWAGDGRHQGWRLEEPRLPSAKRDLYAIAVEMAVHQERDDAAFGQAPADLEGGVEGLPHLDGVRAEPFAHLAAPAVDLRVCFG